MNSAEDYITAEVGVYQTIVYGQMYKSCYSKRHEWKTVIMGKRIYYFSMFAPYEWPVL